MSDRRRLEIRDIDDFIEQLPESEREARALRHERGFTQKLLAHEALRLILGAAHYNPNRGVNEAREADSGDPSPTTRGVTVAFTYAAAREIWEASGLGHGSEQFGVWLKGLKVVDNRDVRGTDEGTG